MSAKVSKRKEVLSLKRVQLKLVACVCLPLILSSLAVSVFQTYFFLSTLRSRHALQTEYAREIIPIAVWVTVIVLLVLISAGFMVTVMVGHRIVGPMRRFGRRLRDMSEGLHGDLVECRAQAARLTEAAGKLRSYGVSGAATEAAVEMEAAAQALAERINAYDLGLEGGPPSKDA